MRTFNKIFLWKIINEIYVKYLFSLIFDFQIIRIYIKLRFEFANKRYCKYIFLIMNINDESKRQIFSIL